MDGKSSVCMANNAKYTKHTRHIDRRMHSVRNSEECNFHKKVRCEWGLQLSDIETNNVRGYELNPILGYSMVRIYDWQNTCTIGVIGYIRVWIIICSEWIDCIDFRIRLNEFEIFIWVYNGELEFRMIKITSKTVLYKC